jgi:hypothetical protein
MSAFLIIERPGHAPRVLGAFSNPQEAETARKTVVAARPHWETLVTVRGNADKRALGNRQRTPRSFVWWWLVALLAVDVVIAYALYLAVRALVDLV